MAAPHGSVLIVADEPDPSADLVVAALYERDVPVLRFDLADFPQRVTLAAEHAALRSGWRGDLATSAGRAVRLEEVRAVYYRRPGLPTLSPAVPDAYRSWARSQALVGMVQILSSMPVLWMHHPDIYRAAAHKPGQLVTAAAAGLSVPRTLVTNSLAQARAWAKTVDGPLACKPVTAGAITLPDAQPTMLPTRCVTAHELDESIELTCHLLQEWVEADFEVRLTVVGDRMFPVAIHAHSAAARADWREDLDDVKPRRTEVPLTDVLDRLSFPLSLALRGHSVCTWNDDRSDRLQAVGIWTPDGSVARATTDGTVREAGEHRLWDCVEQLHRHFPDGRPARDEFTLTVTCDRQVVHHSRHGDARWALPESAVS